MKVCGYSERGIFNCLFYELAYSQASEVLFQSLLDRISFPFIPDRVPPAMSAQVFVEQSFSDFGDSDALALVEGVGLSYSLFFEGKVSKQSHWLIEDEFARFKQGLSTKLDSSNLFVQLYHKVRLVHALETGGIPLLQAGVKFPPCSKKPIRKIGTNPVVLRATEALAKFASGSLFVAVVPDSPQNVSCFFSQVLRSFAPSELTEWNVDRWGFLCWQEVESFCHVHGLTSTCETLEFNRGQIY